MTRNNGQPSFPEVYQKTMVRKGCSGLPSSQEDQ
jgi:hypothetical protein